MSPAHVNPFLSADRPSGVGNVVACMLDLSDGAIEVFNSKPDGAADVPVDDTIEVFAHKGKVEWDEDQSDHYSMKLQHLLERCLSFDPNERQDFPEVLRSI